EIEKVLKKVAEGVEVFEGIFEKIQQNGSQAQKEKFESELKKEIKKLQRYRDQIKTWLSSNEIKDKRALTENRKLIEQCMEKFKACEKELKTKAYSKEGLSLPGKIDPQEKEKGELSDWITEKISELNTQFDAFEAESEGLKLANKKTRKPDPAKTERINGIEKHMERIKWHISQLEIVLRMLENGDLTVDKVKGIKDDVQFYVESNQEDDFQEDEGIYDELNLEEAEVYGFGHDDDKESSTGSLDDLDTPPREKEPAPKPPAIPRTVVAAVAAQKPPAAPVVIKPVVSQPTAPKPPVVPVIPAVPVISKQPIPGRTDSTPLTHRYSTAASGSTSDSIKAQTPTLDEKKITKGMTSPSSTSTTTETSQTSTSILSKQQQQSPVPSAGHLPVAATPSPSVNTSMQIQPQPTAIHQAPVVAKTSINLATSQLPALTQSIGSAQQQQTTAQITSGASRQLTQPEVTNVENAKDEVSSESINPVLPASLADLEASFEAAKERERGSKLKDDKLFQAELFETSFRFLPEVTDSERPSYYMPKTPYPIPSYYPQTPLQVFETSMLFEKFDIDTLFFIFYYQQGTYQ
ncbi:general negative regulator of transcription subunit 5, partial [Nowakowskiella sp. JEL0078]